MAILRQQPDLVRPVRRRISFVPRVINIMLKSSPLLLSVLLTSVWLVPCARTQAHEDVLMSGEVAYNPIPSPDGEYIAYVRTGWGRPVGSGGFGRSNVRSEVAVMDADGNPVGKSVVADAFLSGWTPTGTDLVCFRDGEYFLAAMSGKDYSNSGRLPGLRIAIGGTERVSYLSRSGTVVWSREDEPFHTVLETPEGVIAQHRGGLGEMIAPSPNGRYLAIATSGWPQDTIWIYDTDLKHWTYLGHADIHPDRDWDYIKPSWDPWFGDSSRLAYFTHNNSVLSISTSDGKQRTDIRIDALAGLATPSPDGKYVAYVTFEPRPRNLRPDLQFWGGTLVWVVSLTGTPHWHPVTLRSPDETYDLRWLNDHTLVFDRVADVPLYKQSRIWKADVP